MSSLPEKLDPANSRAPARKRPAAVTWIALLVFLLAGANLAAAGRIIARWSVYASLGLEVPIWVPLVLSAGWGGTWLIVSGELWRLKRWARRAALVLFPLYELTMIGQPLLYAQGAYTRGRLPLIVAAAIALSALVLFILTRPHVRRAFEQAEDAPLGTTEEGLGKPE